jgi:hypothetical protein
MKAQGTYGDDQEVGLWRYWDDFPERPLRIVEWRDGKQVPVE